MSRSANLCLLAMVMVAVPLGLAQQPSPPPAWPPIDPSQARLERTITDLSGPGLAVAAADGPGLLAVGCEDGTIEFWHRDVLLGVRPGDGTANILKGHQGAVLHLAWNGGPLMASAGADHKIILWSIGDGKALHTLKSSRSIRAVAMSPDGKFLASGGEDPSVQLWDVAAAKPNAQLEGHTDWLLCLCFSPDGALLASGGYDGTIRLWDVAKAEKVREFKVEAKAAPKESVIVWSLAFTPDGKTLTAGGADGNIYLFNVADAKAVRTLSGHTSVVTDLQYHPSGTLLVSASRDRTLKLWNPTNAQALKTLEGHASWVEGVAFYQQATRLASVGADRTVKLWDLSKK